MSLHGKFSAEDIAPEIADKVAKQILGKDGFASKLDLILVAGVSTNHFSQHVYGESCDGFLPLLRRLCEVNGIKASRADEVLSGWGYKPMPPSAADILYSPEDVRLPERPRLSTDLSELEFYERAVLAAIDMNADSIYEAQEIAIARKASNVASELVRMRREFIAQNKPT